MDGYKLNAALFVDGETEQVGINDKWFVHRWALKPVKFRFNVCHLLMKNMEERVFYFLRKFVKILKYYVSQMLQTT
jgi:hypothetical protein